MIKYKEDIMQKLKEHDITTTDIKHKNIIGQQSYIDIKNGKMVGLKTLDKLCTILRCDISDLIYYTDQED